MLALAGNALIYCDPPYSNTTRYNKVLPFDTNAFWIKVREWSIAGHTVVVSERTAPNDFRSIWHQQQTTMLRGGIGGTSLNQLADEHLFMYAGTNI